MLNKNRSKWKTCWIVKMAFIRIKAFESQSRSDSESTNQITWNHDLSSRYSWCAFCCFDGWKAGSVQWKHHTVLVWNNSTFTKWIISIFQISSRIIFRTFFTDTGFNQTPSRYESYRMTHVIWSVKWSLNKTLSDLFDPSKCKSRRCY